jgi:hypothetical protein
MLSGVSLRRPAVLATAAAACGMALGALFEYFFDPKGGRRRRHMARDRTVSRMRRGERRAITRARRTRSHALGLARRTMNGRRGDREPLDDTSLAHKVASEAYRRAGVPHDHLSVNAENGVVFLRGVLERQEDIERIEIETRRIEGVRDVQNLVHTPDTPAPASKPKLRREGP